MSLMQNVLLTYYRISPSLSAISKSYASFVAGSNVSGKSLL